MGYNPWGHKESDTTEQLHFKLFIELQPPVEDLAFFFREVRLKEPEKLIKRAV